MTTSNKKDPVIVIVQLTGGNDYLNTVIPYNNSLYKDYRPSVNIDEEIGHAFVLSHRIPR